MDMKKILEQLGSNPGLMQDMQQKVMQAREEIDKRHAKETVSAQSGAGMVEATVNLKGSLVNLSLSDEILSEGKEVVTSMVVSAVNAAIDKSKAQASEDMASLASQFGVPKF